MREHSDDLIFSNSKSLRSHEILSLIMGAVIEGSEFMMRDQCFPRITNGLAIGASDVLIQIHVVGIYCGVPQTLGMFPCGTQSARERWATLIR